MELGLFYFASTQPNAFVDRLIEQAKQAESVGFSFIMYPERHFDPFGGPFNNPLLLGSVIGTHTSSIKIRTGSLIPALHDRVRLLEQLRLMDHCCQGRLELSLGSGWHPNDFIFSPTRFATRKDYLSSFIDQFGTWYQSGTFILPNGVNTDVSLQVYPAALSQDIPLWLTISSRVDAWQYAGEKGLRVFTHMENVDHEALAERIAVYRQALLQAGHPAERARVTVMQHTLVTDNIGDNARQWLKNYLTQGVELEKKSVEHTGAMSGNKAVDMTMLNDDITEDLLERAVDKYLSRTSLICSKDALTHRIQQLKQIGVDEIACLVDFHPNQEAQSHTVQSLADTLHTLRNHESTTKELIDDFCH